MNTSEFSPTQATIKPLTFGTLICLATYNIPKDVCYTAFSLILYKQCSNDVTHWLIVNCTRFRTTNYNHLHCILDSRHTYLSTPSPLRTCILYLVSCWGPLWSKAKASCLEQHLYVSVLLRMCVLLWYTCKIRECNIRECNIRECWEVNCLKTE